MTFHRAGPALLNPRTLFLPLILWTLSVAPAISGPLTSGGVAAPDSLPAHGFWSRYNMSRVAAAGLLGGSLAYSAAIWWVNDFRPWHHDHSGWWDTDMGVDKEGHLYTCYYMFRAIND
ncbi:MAG TPA: hypothetical protein VF889_09385, partial [Bacteroidota bacterium]